MKILLTVELYNPHKGGAEKVVEDLAVGLMKRGHDVTVATTYLPGRRKEELHGVTVESFKLSGNAAGGITGERGEIERYQKFLLTGGFDLIFNYAAQSWPTDLALPLLSQIEAVKVLVPVGYSRLTSAHYKRYFNTLPAYLARYDALVYHSAHYQDKAYGDFNGLADRAVVIHNGALKKEFGAPVLRDVRRELGIGTKYLLVNIAHHNFNKGHRFAIRAFRKMRRNDATLLIVGERFTSRGWKRIAHFLLDYLYCFFTSLLHKHIRLAGGNDRDFVVSVYQAADLHLSGSRLECAPLVMYESFASKTPFVSTNVGNVSDYREYVTVIDTPAEMARAANALLDHPEERKKLAESAFALWEREYVAEDIVDTYEALFLKLTREHTQRHGEPVG